MLKPKFGGKADLVRYADDFCLFFKHPTGPETMKTLLKARLAQFGLTIADEKTHHTNMGARENDGTHARRRMTFLGFTIYRSTNRNQTAENGFGRAKAAMKDKIRRMKHWPVEAQQQTINAMPRGRFNTYGIAGSGKKLAAFWNFTRREWRHSRSKRSQKGRLTWEAFAALLDGNPLTRPKIRIQYPDLPFKRLDM